MADIKEIMEQTGKATGKVIKSPAFLAVCGLGIIALVWNSGNKEQTESVTFSEATGVQGYPDVSGDISTLANNMTAAMDEMYATMENNYLQMQEQQAESFQQMQEQLDNKVSNMEFVQKESLNAVSDYAAGLTSTISSLSSQLYASQEATAAAQEAAAAAKEEAAAAQQTAADALKKAAEATTTTTQKTSSSTAAKATTSSSTKTSSTSSTSSNSSSTKAVTNSIVNAVIRGDYGNGQARVNALTKAGYDAKAVQAAVNKKLLG